MITKDQLIEYYSTDQFFDFFNFIYGWSSDDVSVWAAGLAESDNVKCLHDISSLDCDLYFLFLVAKALVPPSAYDIGLHVVDLPALCEELLTAIYLYFRGYKSELYKRVVKTKVITALLRHKLEFAVLTPKDVVY